MTNPISSFIGNLQDKVEFFHENMDPVYKKQKVEFKTIVAGVGLASTAVLAASVALTVLGIVLATSGGLAALISAPIFMVGLPFLFFSYNGYKISENLNEIVDNPKKYQQAFGLTHAFDQFKVKNKLKQGTFGVSWIITLAINTIAENDQSKPPLFGRH